MTRGGLSWLFAFTAAATLFPPALASAQDLAPPPVGTPPPPGAYPTGTPNPPSSGTTPQPEGTKLATDQKKDSGRGLSWVYLDADAGFSYIDMASVVVQNSASAGPTFGVGAGIRLFILTLGARANLNELSEFSLYQLDGELGFHIPLGHWEPYFGLHGGYCFVGSISQAVSGSNNLSITGGDAGAQVGLDYYFNHYVSLGIEGAGNALFLHRPPASLPSGAESALTPSQQMLYAQSADSIGFGAVGSLHLGLHL